MNKSNNGKDNIKKQSSGLSVKTNVKAGAGPYGGGGVNHNEKIVGDKKNKALVVRTGIKAGLISANHSETLVF